MLRKDGREKEKERGRGVEKLNFSELDFFKKSNATIAQIYLPQTDCKINVYFREVLPGGNGKKWQFRSM